MIACLSVCIKELIVTYLLYSKRSLYEHYMLKNITHPRVDFL